MTMTSSGLEGMSFDDMLRWMLLPLKDTARKAAVTALTSKALVMTLCLVDRARRGEDDVLRDRAW